MQKNVINNHFSLCHYDYMNDILVLDGLTLGQKVKLTRLSKGLRQIDVASQATVQPIDICRLEKDRHVRPTHLKRILAVLGMGDEND